MRGWDESMVRDSPGSSRHEAPNDHGRNAQIETLDILEGRRLNQLDRPGGRGVMPIA
jgi:hypothetical protein